MAKKKKEDKEEKLSEEYSISFLLEKNNVKPLYAVGFLEYYDLSEDFKKEFEIGEVNKKFSEEEFNKMYKEYIEREI